MTEWLLFYDFSDDYVERRGTMRAEHMAVTEGAVERGELVLAGHFAEDPEGGMLIFRGERAVVEGYVRDDPYVREGLVTSWRIRGWKTLLTTRGWPAAAAPPSTAPSSQG